MLRSPLLHFLLVGVALFLINAAWSRVPERPRVEVSQSEIDERLQAYRLQMGRAPNAEEARAIEAQVIDEAIWLDQAFALGLLEIDPVVRQRLVLNMRFLEGETPESEDELVRRAIELGMDRSDTVVQRRLIDRVQAIVRAGVRARPVDADALADYYASTAEDWREPALLDLTHVYFSRDKRGASAESAARELLAVLLRDSIDPEAAILSGDPFLAGHRLRGASPARLVARLGPDFAEAVENLPVAEWSGPIESAFGVHLVWIHERKPSRIPALAEIEKRVFEDWIEQQSREALQTHIRRRREAVDVHIVADVYADGEADGEADGAADATP